MYFGKGEFHAMLKLLATDPPDGQYKDIANKILLIKLGQLTHKRYWPNVDIPWEEGPEQDHQINGM
jgi:hypothetical protein